MDQSSLAVAASAPSCTPDTTLSSHAENVDFAREIIEAVRRIDCAAFCTLARRMASDPACELLILVRARLTAADGFSAILPMVVSGASAERRDGRNIAPTIRPRVGTVALRVVR